MIKILLVEDDKTIVANLTEYLNAKARCKPLFNTFPIKH